MVVILAGPLNPTVNPKHGIFAAKTLLLRLAHMGGVLAAVSLLHIPSPSQPTLGIAPHLGSLCARNLQLAVTG